MNEWITEGGKMKIKITAILVLIVSLIWLSANFHWGENISRERTLSQIIYTGLQRWHYSNKNIDDSFSEKAFVEFLNNLDYGKRFLLKTDVDALRKYKNSIDDEFESGNLELMKTAANIMDQRIHYVVSIYPEILSKPFDFTKNESLEFDSKKRDYFSNQEELKDYWRKVLKYYVLVRYIDLVEDNKKDKKSTPAQMEENARQAVSKNFKSIFNRMLQSNQKDSISRFFNSIIQVFDPHSIYFPPVDKETFDMQMSGSFEGIGATLQDENEYVKISSIVPGSPAWRQKKIQPGDYIIKVAQGNDEPVDIIGIRSADAVKLIRGKKGTLVRLTIKKPDGVIVEVPIIRDVIVLEETFAKSAILTDIKSQKKIGYIYLPGFYDDFRTAGGRNSSDDVRKELEKLKAQNVSGVILDLRNNGGGALNDAVRMSGLFISKGPIVQVKNKKEKIDKLDDLNPDITYSGPLVIMVNQLSASASEILSAALQDYNRAIIVGSNTYGKGTVQAMVNLDQFLDSNEDKDMGLGALTITIQQFYRITGSSIQTKGVTPDILLPDRFDSLKIGEKYLDHSLKWNSIPPAQYQKWTSQSLLSPQIVLNSQNRVKSSIAFQAIDDYIKNVKQTRDNTLQSLQFDDAQKQDKQINLEAEKLEKTRRDTTVYSISPTSENSKKDASSLDKIAKEIQDEWFKGIKRDIEIEEAVDVLMDVVNKSTIR